MSLPGTGGAAFPHAVKCVMALVENMITEPDTVDRDRWFSGFYFLKEKRPAEGGRARLATENEPPI